MRHSTLVLAALLAAACVLLAATPAAGTPAQTPKRGGTIVAGSWREPPCVNAFLVRCGDNVDPQNIMRLALRGAFVVGPGFSWRPDLVTKADFTTEPPYTITYHIRPEARWSDGVPITASDFVFTQEVRRSVADQLINWEREHLNVIRSVKAVDSKTVEVVLHAKFALWRGLFRYVLPRHALRGEDFSTIWLDRIHNPKTGAPIASGPFVLGGWERGRALTFVRNPRYWGSRPARLDGVVLRFCRSCGDLVREQIEWLRSGELDLAVNTFFSGQEIQDARRLSGVRTLAAPGPVWEHFEIRIGSGGHPLLRRKQVRRAIAYGIDRPAIARALYGAVDARYPLSDSAVYPTGSARYRANWSVYRYQPAEARRLLERDGCRPGSDGIYVCGGERLSLRFVTTGDDPLRVRTLELVQAQLRQAGVEVRPVYGTRSAVLSQILPAGDFDLILFAFTKQTPNDPAISKVIYGCGDLRNYSGYCQRLVTRELAQARRILDEAHLARVLNNVDAQLARDVPVVPLFERPLVAAFTTALRGVSLETRGLDPFANVENWWLDD